MPQTKQGAAANGWLQFQRQCAKDYHAQKQSEKDRGTSHATAKTQTKAEKAKEVDVEVKKEKSKATKLHKAATKQLRANAVAVDKQKKADDTPKRAAAQQRLTAEAQKAQNAMHNDAVARAHATVLKRRREKSKP